MEYAMSRDAALELAKGVVGGHSVRHIMGENLAIALGTKEDITDVGGTYPWPTNTFASGTVTCATVLENTFSMGTVTCATVLENTFSTGTVTCATAVVDDTVTVNGLVYTAVAGARQYNNEFSIDTGNDETALDLAAAITADIRTGTLGNVSAVSASAVVTITSDQAGTAGDATTLVSSDGATLAVSGATFSGGVAADTVTINGLVYTAVAGARSDNTEFSTDTGDTETAEDLVAAINADTRTGTLGDVSAANALGVVTITTDVDGTAGDAITLTSTDGVTLAVSGATFGSGHDADTCTINGLTYTAVAGTKADATEFSTDTSNTATGIDLAASINADTRTGTAGTVSATESTGVVTCTTSVKGVAGNAITLASTDGATLAVSAAAMAGGVFEVMTKVSQTTDQAAMRGATIELTGLAVDWTKVVQTVTLDGTLTTTPVVLTTPMIRCNEARVLADIVTDQPIRLHNDAESVDYAIIQAGKNRTRMGVYSVALGETAFITKIFGSTVETTSVEPLSTNLELWIADRANGYAFEEHEAVAIPLRTGKGEHTYNPYKKVDAQHDIKLSALANVEASHVNAGFSLISIT